MIRKSFTIAFLLAVGLAASPAWSIPAAPVIRVALPVELSAGVRVPYETFACAELRGGIALSPADYASPLGTVLTVEHWLGAPGFPLELGVYVGIGLFDPDTGFLVLPRWGFSLGGRFSLWAQSWLASLSLGFGSADYSEIYEGAYFASERIGTAYEPRLTAVLSWRGESVR